MVRRIYARIHRRMVGVSVWYAFMTVEASPYGIVKAMSFRMSFRAVAIGGLMHLPLQADDLLCVNAGAYLKSHAWKRRSTESQSQETHGCFQKAVGLTSF